MLHIEREFSLGFHLGKHEGCIKIKPTDLKVFAAVFAAVFAEQ